MPKKETEPKKQLRELVQKFRGMTQAELDSMRDEIVSLCEVDTDNGCWLYPVRNEQGYGQKRIAGGVMAPSRFMLCHDTRTPLTIPYDACHKIGCTSRSCCNPQHLFWGDRSKNAEQREEQEKDASNGWAYPRFTTDYKPGMEPPLDPTGPPRRKSRVYTFRGHTLGPVDTPHPLEMRIG